MKALVKQAVASLNIKPEQNCTLSDEVMSGMIVEILTDAGNGWLDVKTSYNYTGFIHADNIITDEKTIADWENANLHFINHCSVDILAAPKVQGCFVDNLTKGCLISVIRMETETEGWAEVETPKGRGYMRKRFITPMLPIYDYTDEAAFRDRLIKEAESYIGTQYRWGGKTPIGIDCSGLCSMAYLINGVSIFRDASIAEGFPVKKIERAELKKGDLIFFPGHIAMYVGDGRYIHSSARNDGVFYNSLNPGDHDYWENLASTITECGSIFA